MQKRAVRRSSLAGVFLLLVACAFSASCETAERASSRTVAVNLLLDIGDPFDLAPRHTEIAANAMKITGPIDEPEATPLTGAAVSVEIEGVAAPIDMAETGAGSGVYTAASGTGGNAALVYTSGASYTITIDASKNYKTTVTAPPRTNATGFPDTGNGDTHTSNTDLVLQLTGSYDRGIVLVLNSAGDVTYDNRPQTVQDAIDFVFGDFDGNITIPGSAFPAPGTAYGVVVAGLDSAPTSGISSNLNILSRFYAGSAKTAVVITTP
jgi:hypothetical protein